LTDLNETCNNFVDYVTRHFNASSGGLKKLVKLDLRSKSPLYAITRSKLELESADEVLLPAPRQDGSCFRAELDKS